MVDRVQVLDERVFDQIDFFEGQVAFIELTIEKFFHCDIIDEVLDT